MAFSGDVPATLKLLHESFDTYWEDSAEDGALISCIPSCALIDRERVTDARKDHRERESTRTRR